MLDALPQFAALIMVVILILGIVDEKTISMVLGKDTGLLGIIIAGAFGSTVLIPALIAFPLAANLLKMGAGYGQVTALLETLTMVGIVTLPMEIRYFGKRQALIRNSLCFVFSIAMSLVFYFIY